MRESGKWLIHFSADDWWRSNPHSRHHIVREFQRRGYRILWVNPMGMRFPSLHRRGAWKRVLNKIRSALRTVREAEEGFYVVSPLFFPVFRRGSYETANRWLISGQIGVIMRMLGVSRPLCFATLPTFAPVIEELANGGKLGPVVYYYSDQYDRYREIRDRGPILAWDAMLRHRADAIYCASQEIFENISERDKAVKVVRVIEHQVDFQRFDYMGIEPEPLGIDPPVIGYFGTLTDSNDWSIVEHVARARPDWNLVFIGRKQIEVPRVEALPNVHFIDFVPYERLPSVAVNFSVGLMFWKLTDWIRACSPLKLKEYLALGLPVVSVPILEVERKYSEFVEIAADGAGFVHAIERGLTRGRRADSREFARRFSWQAAVDGIVEDLTRLSREDLDA